MGPMYQIGDLVLTPAGEGVVTDEGFYDDYVGQYRYKVAYKDRMNRVSWNENSLVPSTRHKNPPIWAKQYIPLDEEGDNAAGYYVGGRYNKEGKIASRIYAGPSQSIATRLDPETLEPLSQFWQAPGSDPGRVYYTKADVARAGGWVGPGFGQKGAFRKKYDDPWERYKRLMAAAGRKATRDLKRRKKEGLPIYPFPKPAAPKSGGKGIGKLHKATPEEIEEAGSDFSDVADWELAYDTALERDADYRKARADYRALTPEEKRGRGRPKGTKDYIKRQRRTKAQIEAGVEKYAVPHKSEHYDIRARQQLTKDEAIERFERQRPATHHSRWDNMSWEDKKAYAANLDNMTYRMAHGKNMPGYMPPVIPLKKIPMGLSGAKPPGKAKEWTDETDPWGIERGITDIPDTYVSTLTPKTKTDWWTDPDESPLDVQAHIVKRGRGRPPGSKNKRPAAPIIQIAAPQYRKRGRPPGSKNKPKAGSIMLLAPEMPKRGRGRPPGSKNKTKYANPSEDGDYMSAVRMNPGSRNPRVKGAKAPKGLSVPDPYDQGMDDAMNEELPRYPTNSSYMAGYKDYDLYNERYRNPRVKGAKDTYKRVRRTAGELMAAGIEDSAEGMPPMSKNKHYLKGYKQAKTHPKLKGAARPDVARARQLGIDAFNAGAKAIPAYDVALNHGLIREYSGDVKAVNKILDAWLAGWTAANLEQPQARAAKTAKQLKLEAEQDFYRYNPMHHITKAGRGRPTTAWWILDMYSARGKRVATIIGQGSKAHSTKEAKSFINKSYRGYQVRKVELSGPYLRQPTAKTLRK